MREWLAKFFEWGHPIEYVYDMNYWEYVKLTEAFARITEKMPTKGHFSSGGVTDVTTKKMIQKYKEGKK
jgi:hypothetical protein